MRTINVLQRKTIYDYLILDALFILSVPAWEVDRANMYSEQFQLIRKIFDQFGQAPVFNVDGLWMSRQQGDGQKLGKLISISEVDTRVFGATEKESKDTSPLCTSKQ